MTVRKHSLMWSWVWAPLGWGFGTGIVELIVEHFVKDPYWMFWWGMVTALVTAPFVFSDYAKSQS